MSSSYLPATTDSIAQALEAKAPSEAISILYRVLENPSSAYALRIKEHAITNLSDLLRQENRAKELSSLLTQLRPFFALIPKAKTAKIVRGIIDDVAKIPGTSDAPQRSDEWFALRRNKLTTSTFSTALGFWKGKRRCELWHEKVFASEAKIVEHKR